MLQKLRDGNLGVPSSDFLLAVSRGRVDGAKIVSKFAYNYAVGSSEPMQTIWDGSPANTGTYTYPLDGTSTVDCYSTDSSDTSVEITILGLDEDGYELSETVTLNGLTAVTSTHKFYRIFRAFNSGSEDLVGDVEIFKNGSVAEVDQAAFIGSKSQQTLFGGYTIPKGKTGYSFGLHITTGKGKETRIGVFRRDFGGVFRMGDLIVCYQNSTGKTIPFIKIPELSDIEARAISDADNTNVSIRYDILLLDNDLFG